MNLDKKIKQWKNAGLLSEKQAYDIATYEKQTSKPYALYSLMALAAFFIGLGIVSVTAANWDLIPAVIKLGVSFGLLSVCGIGVWLSYLRHFAKTFEALLILFAFLIMVQIGLIGQIYQLQANGAAPFLFWSVLVLPLTFFCKKPYLPLIWLPVFYISLYFCIDDAVYFSTFFEMVWAIFWFFLWNVIYQVMKIYYPDKMTGLQKATKFWLIADVASLLIFMDFGRFNLFETSLALTPYVSGWLILILLLWGISLLLAQKQQDYIQPIIMSLIFIGSWFSLGFVLSLLGLSIAAIYAYQKNMPRIFNFVILLMAMRIFILYAESFYSLLSGGFGMIFAGVLLLLLLWGWRKISVYIKRSLFHVQ